MEELVVAVYEFCSLERIKALIARVSVEDLWKLSEDGVDIMHHAVLSGHGDVISLLHEMAPVLDDEPSVSIKPKGYLHLACWLGRENVVRLICDGPDVDVTVGAESVTWPGFDLVKSFIKKSKKYPVNSDQLDTIERVYQQIQAQKGNRPPLLAVDIAAMAGHVGCVIAVLNSPLVRYSGKQSSFLERALDLGSLHAFRLLLNRKPDLDSVDSALRTSLSRKLPEFVAALLDSGADISRALNCINPFHFIFLCSPNSYVRQVNAIVSRHVNGIDVMTALLIERGFDVNVDHPPGTFPLYSLLASLIQAKDNNPSQIPKNHIRALEIMLRANAQTDKNELAFVNNNLVSPSDVSVLSAEAGRELATSALNAFFAGLQVSDTWRAHIAEHLDRICLALLEHGACAAGSKDVVPTPLHDLMRATATQHAIGHMHADLSTMSRMLLYFGADPNRTNSCSQYPIESYFSHLLGSMGGLIAFRRWKATNNAAQVIHVLYFMDSEHACNAERRIIALLESARTDGMPDDVVEFVSSLMDAYIRVPKCLQELAMLALWKAVCRRVPVLRSIHMPKAFLEGIFHMFNLHI